MISLVEMRKLDGMTMFSFSKPSLLVLFILLYKELGDSIHLSLNKQLENGGGDGHYELMSLSLFVRSAFGVS